MVLYGKKALLDNINKEIVHVDLLPNDNSIIKLLQEKGINYSIRDKGFFAKFDKKLNHQGVIIHIETNVKYENFNDFLKQDLKKSIVLVVDSIQDPQNFGSILRTCDAFAVDAIIYKKDNQVQINDFVIKSSMGAVNNLNIFREVNLTDALNKLKDKGYWVYSSALSDVSQNYDEIKYDEKTVLVIGNESDGISKRILEQSDFIVKIPMFGNVQSLNVSVATGILLAKIREN